MSTMTPEWHIEQAERELKKALRAVKTQHNYSEAWSCAAQAEWHLREALRGQDFQYVPGPSPNANRPKHRAIAQPD